MFVQCKDCGSRLGWNHKTDRRLSELRCPHCGGGYRKVEPGRRYDPHARHETLVWRFQSAVERFEAALVMARQLAPTLAELADLLAEIQLPHGLPGWDRDDRGTVQQ